jgi:hypothetical protein
MIFVKIVCCNKNEKSCHDTKDSNMTINDVEVDMTPLAE